MTVPPQGMRTQKLVMADSHPHPSALLRAATEGESCVQTLPWILGCQQGIQASMCPSEQRHGTVSQPGQRGTYQLQAQALEGQWERQEADCLLGLGSGSLR